MKFYNVHTHVAKNTPDEIRNVIFGWDDPVSKGYYCGGAQPLFYEWTKDFYSKLLKMCTPKAAVAVGECGFDKRSPMPFSEQTELFMTHVHVSEELRKPLMIHCVGFFNELVRIKKDSSPSQPWIIHGFRKNPELAAGLVSQGFYFSIGKEGVRRQGLLETIPLDKLFLETDEDTELTIEETYREAASTIGIDVELLAERVEANFSRVFLGEQK